jgi:DNA-damage-inducible protein J
MTTTISIRTDSALKKKASKIFDHYGLNMSTAFNMYLSDIVEGRTRPTSDSRYVDSKTMRMWEKERKEALASGVSYSSVEDMWADMKNW